jgi:hypothetical protein
MVSFYIAQNTPVKQCSIKKKKRNKLKKKDVRTCGMEVLVGSRVEDIASFHGHKQCRQTDI